MALVIYLSKRLNFYFLYFIMLLMKEQILKVGRRLFTPPVSAEDEKNQAVSQIYEILWIQILSIIVIGIVLSVLVPVFIRYWLALTFSTIVISLVLLKLAKGGRTYLSGILLVIELWTIITVFAWTAAGIGARAAWGYFIVVFIAGMLLGRTAGIITAGICSFTTLAIAFLSPARSPYPVQFWLTNTMYLVFIILLQFLASRSIRELLAKTGSELRERLLAQAALFESERKHREMVNYLPFCVFEADLSGRLTFINQTAMDWFGYNEADFSSGLNIMQIVAVADVQRVKENIERIFAGKEVIYHEYQVRRKDGSQFTALIRTRRIFENGIPVGLQGSLIDISDRKQSEEALLVRNQFISSLLRAIPVAVFFKDKDGKYTGCNDAFTEIMGVTSDEIKGKTVHEIWPSELAETYHQKDLELIQERKYQVYEFQVKDKHGQLRPVIYAKDVFLDANGEVGGLVGAFLDITDRKQAEMALQESEQRYRTLIESAGDAIFVMKENIFFDCNSKTMEMFGCLRNQIIGVSPDRLSPLLQPDGRNSQEKALEKINAAYSGTPQFFEWLHSKADGTPFMTEVSLNRVELGSGRYLLALVRDISERKMLEEQLRQAQKMEAVGILAGGVAHDFNNILSSIVGYASLLQMLPDLDKKMKEYLEHILASTERAASLTHSLLAFSRKQAIELQPVDINEAIFGFHKVLARLIGEDIDFTLKLASESLVVDADIRQIEQVLMNLATNARDAMPDGGKLTITTRSMVLQDGHGETSNGSYAVISVSDTGTGMNSEIQSHLFEPFFTTKEVGKGTGLGLAIAYGIVKNHQGFIKIDSKSAQGTTFHIYLPLKPLEVQKDRRKKQAKIPRGNETILLVEDDAAVRQVTKTMLEEFGYTVLEAADGQEALAVFVQHRDQVRLLLSDLIMPKKNGRETCAGIMKLKPDIKTIFMSGYTSDIIARKGILDPGIHLLLKPLHPADLLAKIREVLDT
jgi:PAS domain S-box-containing protein